MRAELKQRQKIRMNLFELINLLDTCTVPHGHQHPRLGELKARKREILRKYNLSEADIPRLRRALSKGEYRILAKEKGGDVDEM